MTRKQTQDALEEILSKADDLLSEAESAAIQLGAVDPNDDDAEPTDDRMQTVYEYIREARIAINDAQSQ